MKNASVTSKKANAIQKGKDQTEGFENKPTRLVRFRPLALTRSISRMASFIVTDRRGNIMYFTCM